MAPKAAERDDIQGLRLDDIPPLADDIQGLCLDDIHAFGVIVW